MTRHCRASPLLLDRWCTATSAALKRRSETVSVTGGKLLSVGYNQIGKGACVAYCLVLDMIKKQLMRCHCTDLLVSGVKTAREDSTCMNDKI